MRLDSSHTSARAEALYSTGSVTSEKSADMAIMPTPIQHRRAFCVAERMPRPIRMTHVAMRDEKLTTGTSCERSTSGA